MSSFYTQQSQTLFSANHFTNQTVIQPGMVYTPNMVPTVPRSRLVYVLAPDAYVPKQHQLPADWISRSQPLPSTTHRVSKPPQPAFVEEEPAFIAEAPKVEETVAPPAFERHLSDPSFLLQTEEEKRALAPEPPKFNKELSDPAFLLEGTPQVEEILEVLDEWTYEPQEILEVLDEWTYTPPQEPLRFQRERSRSSESGSSAITDNRNRVQRKPIVPHSERGSTIQINTQKAPAKAQPKPKPAKQGWETIEFVKVKKRKRKIIEIGQVYRTKRFVKVTKGLDPHHYGKPKGSRRERDRNEVWTVRPGVHMEVLDIIEKRAEVECTVTYWTKHQDKRREPPREKYVRGWISLKDEKGWVL